MTTAATVEDEADFLYLADPQAVELAAIFRGGMIAASFDRASFWGQVQFSADSCWLWTGVLDRDGYGKFWDGSKLHVAHRFAYFSIIGRATRSQHVDHLCRVRRCVHPAHLQAVTPAVNNERSNSISRRNADKTHCRNGHPYSGENLIAVLRPDGTLAQRDCRICARARHLKSDRKRRMRLRAQTTDVAARGAETSVADGGSASPARPVVGPYLAPR